MNNHNMNERQKMFCEYYAENGGNGAAAARKAGYSSKTAREIARKLLTNVDIIEYIRELQDETASLRIASIIQAKAFWSDVLRDTEQKMTDRLKASELLAKSAGDFVDPHDDSLPGNINSVQIYMPYTARDEGCEIERKKM